MVAAISTSITASVTTFNEFIKDIKQNYGLNELREKRLFVGAWEDELGRLRIWAANIGAHQTGCSSLDFRLRDASHIRGQIMKLLKSLLQKLQDTRVALAEKENYHVGVIDELVDLEEAKTEIQELQEGVATIVDCLFQMSMLVRKPTQHDLRLGSKDAQVAAFEQYDYNHVREKYPRADNALVKRLSNSITLRRKYLVYRERNAMELKQGYGILGPAAYVPYGFWGGRVTEGTELSNNVATDSPPDVAFDDNASDSEVSQTSDTPTPTGEGNITIPLAPKSSLRGLPFECPYCFCLTTISERRSWRKHVFQDLPPYICVAPTCLTPDKLYSTKHEWLHHSSIAHLEVSPDHNATQNSSALCPLCIEDVERGKSYDRHLARHLEDLALFVLPRSDEDSNTSISASKFGKGSSEINESESSEVKDWPHELTVVQRSLPTTIGEESLGDPQSASSFGNLALSENEAPSDTKRKQKHEESRLLRQYEKNREVLGDQNLETLASMESLAVSYGRAKKFQEAESLLRQVVTTRASISGADHPDTLSRMTNLAHILMERSTLDIALDFRERRNLGSEAQRFYERALIGYDKVYGSEHPSTLNLVQLLGKFFTGYGKLAEAGAFYQRAVPGYIKVYGLEHRSTLDITRCFGDNLTRRGKLEESESLYKRVLDRYDKACGSEHPFTLNIVQLLGNYFMTQGKLAEARAFYQRAVPGYVNVYGTKHLSPIDVTLCLGDISARQGKLGEAEMSYKWALAESEKLYGHEHESLIKVVWLLYYNLLDQGKVAEANALFQTGILNIRS